MKPGDRIENYVLIEQIGRGGQAVVWSAEDEQLKRTVAIKTINLIAPITGGGSSAATVSAEEQAVRFRAEAKTIAELEHPFILPIYSFGQKDEWLYIIMRYMPGGTLRRLIDHGGLDVQQVIKLIEPLSDALDMAHERRIIHRDIKSVNILLDAQKRPYLAEFGLSVTAGDSTSTSGSGTLAYMSPEQLRGEPVDHRSDLYAFGVLIFELLTGEIPRSADGQHWNLAQLTRYAPLPVPENIPDKVAEVLRKATALNKEDRYPNARMLLEDLKVAAKQPELAPIIEEDEGLIMLLPSTDPAVQASIEAVRIAENALSKWADGAGRFRLYEEDFKYVDSFYRVGDEIGIEMSDAAVRLMLRGALEHGYSLDYWWGQVINPADRRAVTLQTLSSELPTARLRAIEHLMDIQDSEPPAIPIRVATIMSKEPEPAVRLAGIALLEKRGGQPKTWRDIAYSPEIDAILANLAALDPNHQVRHAAARAVARLRSSVAAKQIGEQATKGSATAFEALIRVRDTANSLPAGIASGLRLRAFGTLTVRQFFQPGLLARLAGAALGFLIGWTLLVVIQWGTPETRARFVTEAVGNGLAGGALYGVLFGVVILFATEPPARLRAWNPAARITLGLVLGGGLSIVAFLIMRRFYYFDTEPVENWGWFLLPSVLFIVGFALVSGISRRAWLRALAGCAGMAVALYLSHLSMVDGQVYTPLMFFREESPNQPLFSSIWLAAVIALFAFIPDWLRALRTRAKVRMEGIR